VDTDAAGVMHYSNYFRQFEACEEEFYRSMGLSFRTIYKKYGIGLPRVEAHCTYKSSCHFDDKIEITLEVGEITEKTITYNFQALVKDDDRLAADGFLKCIAVNEKWKAVPIPENFVKVIRSNGA
jgi:acyl-CoA thioester hydrolase